jgi:hypothetical protein
VIGENIRITVRTLFSEGKAKKEIARLMGIDIKTVRSILDRENDQPKERSDKIDVPDDLLISLHESCHGYAHRMYEELTENHGFNIGYSTLTRLLREKGIGHKTPGRSDHYGDVPGEEMQHDTSPYTIQIGGKSQKVICSGLYLRYSKMRYLRFYPVFNRFVMKCFLHEALMHFGYSASVCIIDNTNLAIEYGTGENAVFNPEMIQFANQYGFRWKAHRIKHSNRKAGVERSFFTVETSFFPGRTFSSYEDLNAQAKQWAIVRYSGRPQSRTKLIPRELFEHEKPFLQKVEESTHPPYLEHHRLIDAYGYVALNGNYYWIPEEKGLGRNFKVIEYEGRMTIFQNHRKIIEYKLPEYGVRNQRFSPPGIKVKSQPNNRKRGSSEEEAYLRALGSESSSFLDFIHSAECLTRQKSKLIRDLYALSKKVSRDNFTETLKQALKYKVDSIHSIERIAQNLLQNDLLPETDILVESDYQSREEYRKGRFSCEANLQGFQKLLDKKDGNDE